MASGWSTSDPIWDQRTGSGLAIYCVHLIPGDEHVALLSLPASSSSVRRKDDLLDEGVAAIFALTSGVADLVGLCFHAGKFTPDRAAQWLSGRGFTPLLFVTNARSSIPVGAGLDRPGA